MRRTQKYQYAYGPWDITHLTIDVYHAISYDDLPQVMSRGLFPDNHRIYFAKTAKLAEESAEHLFKNKSAYFTKHKWAILRVSVYQTDLEYFTPRGKPDEYYYIKTDNLIPPENITFVRSYTTYRRRKSERGSPKELAPLKTEKSRKATPDQIREIAVLCYKLGIDQPNIETYMGANRVIEILKDKRDRGEEYYLSSERLEPFTYGEQWMRNIEDRVDLEIRRERKRIIYVIKGFINNLTVPQRKVLFASRALSTRKPSVLRRETQIDEEYIIGHLERAEDSLRESWTYLRDSGGHSYLPANIDFEPYIREIIRTDSRRLIRRDYSIEMPTGIEHMRLYSDDEPFLVEW